MLHSNCFLVLASVYIKHFRIFGCRVLPCLLLILRNWERVSGRWRKKHIRGQGRMPHSRADAFVVQWAHCFWEFERGEGVSGVPAAGNCNRIPDWLLLSGLSSSLFVPSFPVAAAATRCCQLQWGNMGFQVRLSVTLIKHIYLKAIFSRPTFRKKNSRANNWK